MSSMRAAAFPRDQSRGRPEAFRRNRHFSPGTHCASSDDPLFMITAVISPESEDPREVAVLGGLLERGLDRYHLRKPGWPDGRIAAWLGLLPAAWRRHVVLHQSWQLAVEYGCGGVHEKEGAEPARLPAGARLFSSRSCHSLASVASAQGRYDSVFLSPVFPSLSKPGYRAAFSLDEASRLLGGRTPDQRRTQVVALGGITAENAGRAIAMGFDGVAAMGAVWQSADPVGAFVRVKEALIFHAA